MGSEIRDRNEELVKQSMIRLDSLSKNIDEMINVNTFLKNNQDLHRFFNERLYSLGSILRSIGSFGPFPYILEEELENTLWYLHNC